MIEGKMLGLKSSKDSSARFKLKRLQLSQQYCDWGCGNNTLALVSNDSQVVIVV